MVLEEIKDLLHINQKRLRKLDNILRIMQTKMILMSSYHKVVANRATLLEQIKFKKQMKQQWEQNNLSLERIRAV